METRKIPEIKIDLVEPETGTKLKVKGKASKYAMDKLVEGEIKLAQDFTSKCCSNISFNKFFSVQFTLVLSFSLTL